MSSAQTHPRRLTGRGRTLGDMISNRISERDAGLRRISRVTRWALSGGVALTIGLSGVAASVYSGASPASPEIVAVAPFELVPDPVPTTTTTTAPPASPGPTAATSAPTATLAATTTTLQPPVQAPIPTTKKARARSGGS